MRDRQRIRRSACSRCRAVRGWQPGLAGEHSRVLRVSLAYVSGYYGHNALPKSMGARSFHISAFGSELCLGPHAQHNRKVRRAPQ